jgi:hypothetical protein
LENSKARISEFQNSLMCNKCLPGIPNFSRQLDRSYSLHLTAADAEREENQLLVFERKVLRTICGPKIENGVYRRRYNHELDKEFDSPNALNVTKNSRLHYAGHMIRRPEDLPKKALFRSKPNGRRNQGRLKSRWANGVNSDTLALGVRDWTHCAQDRQSWKDLLEQALTKYWLSCHISK